MSVKGVLETLINRYEFELYEIAEITKIKKRALKMLLNNENKRSKFKSVEANNRLIDLWAESVWGECLAKLFFKNEAA